MFSRLQNTLGTVAMVISCSSMACADDAQVDEQQEKRPVFSGDQRWENNNQCYTGCWSSDWDFEVSAGVVFAQLSSNLRPIFNIGSKLVSRPGYDWDSDVGFYLDARMFNSSNWGIGLNFLWISFDASAEEPLFNDRVKLKADADYSVGDAYWINRIQFSNCNSLSAFAGLRFASVDLKTEDRTIYSTPPSIFARTEKANINSNYDILGLRLGARWDHQIVNCFDMYLHVAGTIGAAKVDRKVKILLDDGGPVSTTDYSSDCIGMLGFDAEIGGRYSICMGSYPGFIDVGFFAHGWDPLSTIEDFFRTGTDDGFVLYGLKAGIGMTF